MTQYGHKLKQRKGAEIVAALSPFLMPGEEILFVTQGVSFKPMVDHIVVTNLRVGGISRQRWVRGLPFSETLTLVADASKKAVTVTSLTGQKMAFRGVPGVDHPELEQVFREAASSRVPADVMHEFERASQRLSDEASRAERARARQWPGTKVLGNGRLSSKASQAVFRQCLGDEPWLIIVSSGGAGLLAAFEDRLAIIKTGAWTSMMAGSFGGERAATLYYRDITGVEYNSGLFNGVLEVLTASYNGTANRDFWRGALSSRNADSNDPHTLSNTLPLTKPEYRAALGEINELRKLVAASKTVHTPAASAPDAAPSPHGIAAELASLAELRESGVLSESEFEDAKRRVLSGR